MLEASGYNKIFTAHDGVEALSILSANGENIYVTVLDIVMPRMSGTAVIKHLSNIHAFPVGIIIISGYSSREDIKDILNQNVGNIFTTNFIGKPFQVNDIIQDVEKALDYIHEKRKKQLSLSVEEIQNQITEFKENTNIDLLAIVNNE
ncbi:MAG: response regulator, partial [candidate division Zixibacteria bacterium]|nr:response regulator [candidate division Zixibacteria bacterium]NIW46552.1 response regulator [Gammaproteobacteria bacterium]NIS47154.1 response regulator [candidate division Zixibacteria bacterium]NIU15291.1 response regulator [candidate division Zixibacteria bacterium]NIV07364.1 response regulator [candidate division Zixibacteria bacterium]